MHEFVNNRDKATYEVVPIPFVLVRDPFLRLKKRMGPTLNLKTARNGLAAPDLKQNKRVNIPNKHYATTKETPWKRKLLLCSLTTSKKKKGLLEEHHAHSLLLLP